MCAVVRARGGRRPVRPSVRPQIARWIPHRRRGVRSVVDWHCRCSTVLFHGRRWRRRLRRRPFQGRRRAVQGRWRRQRRRRPLWRHGVTCCRGWCCRRGSYRGDCCGSPERGPAYTAELSGRGTNHAGPQKCICSQIKSRKHGCCWRPRGWRCKEPSCPQKRIFPPIEQSDCQKGRTRKVIAWRIVWRRNDILRQTAASFNA